MEIDIWTVIKCPYCGRNLCPNALGKYKCSCGYGF